MNDGIARSIKKTSALHIRAARALKARDYKLAETLYKQALETTVGMLDPIHTAYVDMLKGLRTCLNRQSKLEEAAKIELMISQLCLGQ